MASIARDAPAGRGRRALLGVKTLAKLMVLTNEGEYGVGSARH